MCPVAGYPQYEGETADGFRDSSVLAPARAPRHDATMQPMPTPPRKPPPPARSAPRPQASPLGEDDIEALQELLDAVPAPLQPLDASMLDGFLCGVLVQPQRIPESRW